MLFRVQDTPAQQVSPSGIFTAQLLREEGLATLSSGWWVTCVRRVDKAAPCTSASSSPREDREDNQKRMTEGCPQSARCHKEAPKGRRQGIAPKEEAAVQRLRLVGWGGGGHREQEGCGSSPRDETLPHRPHQAKANMGRHTCKEWRCPG